MKKESAISFVRWNENNYISLNLMGSTAFVDYFLLFFSLVAFLVSGKGLIGIITLGAIALGYTGWYLLLKYQVIKNTYRLRFFNNLIEVVHMYLLFYVFLLSFVNMSDVGATLWQNIEFTVVLIATPIIANVLMYLAVRKGMFLNKESKPMGNVRIAAMAGAAIGIFASRFLEMVSISQAQAINILLLIGEILFLLLSVGAPNYLKCYYALKYHIVTDEEGKNTSSMLLYVPKQERKAKKIGKLFLTVGVVLFAILLLIGITQSMK